MLYNTYSVQLLVSRNLLSQEPFSGIGDPGLGESLPKPSMALSFVASSKSSS